MAREYNEYEKEVYFPPVKDESTDDIHATETEENTETDTNATDNSVVDTVDDYTQVTTTTTTDATNSEQTQQEETPPAYKAKKFIEVEDEAALFQKLNAKYGHTTMKSDEKALAFLREQNPELDDAELAFLAATDYGIGTDRPDEDELTTEQIAALKKQDIARKKLTSQADAHFASRAEQVALDGYDPLELDPEYKEYRSKRKADEAERIAQQQHIADVTANIESAAKTISEIAENFEIDLDESKLAVPVSFKLDSNRQKQLEDFAKRYTPSQEEYDQFNDPKTGKFDYKGYMQHIAPLAFAKDIVKAAIKQGLAQDRTNFVEKELKNSTLRNNDVSDTTVRKVDAHDWYWNNVAGK